MSKVKNWVRYIKYLSLWIFKEKIKGLDFSMRDLSMRNALNNGYARTSDYAISQIKKRLPQITSDDCFIDIGCGKGYVLWKFSALSFGKIVGIEISSKLTKIAQKNMNALNIDNKVEIITGDALKYNNFHLFNYIFMYNPFSEEIHKKIATKLINSISTNKDKDIYIICCGKNAEEVFELSNILIKLESFEEVEKGSRVTIWKTY